MVPTTTTPLGKDGKTDGRGLRGGFGIAAKHQPLAGQSAPDDQALQGDAAYPELPIVRLQN
jgi:hypothetical protein